MQGLGIGALLLGYCCWYTLYQRTWGDGSSFLYNLTGSTRFPGPIPSGSGKDTGGGVGSQVGQQIVSGQNNQGGQGPTIRH